MDKQKGYAYTPLMRRMDVDRLYHALLESNVIDEVWPWGKGPQNGERFVYKVYPWSHMNCCKLLCTTQGDSQKWEIGVTDNKMDGIVLSISGARLYVKGPPAKSEQARQVLLTALSVLPETDVELTADVEVTWGGKKHPWGYACGAWNDKTECFQIKNKLPSDRQWDLLELSDQQARLDECLKWADTQGVPNNSQIRESLGIYISLLAKAKVQDAEKQWQDTLKLRLLGSSRSTLLQQKQQQQQQQQTEPVHEKIQTAFDQLAQIGKPIKEPPKPAPGYHDAHECPELVDQWVPSEEVQGPATPPPGSDGVPELEEKFIPMMNSFSSDLSAGSGSAGSAGVSTAGPGDESAGGDDGADRQVPMGSQSSRRSLSQ